MLFWLPLGVLLFGSIMCWMNGLRKTVFVCWGLWILGFFVSPILFGHDAAFTALQGALAVTILLRWKIYDALP